MDSEVLYGNFSHIKFAYTKKMRTSKNAYTEKCAHENYSYTNPAAGTSSRLVVLLGVSSNCPVGIA
jgi:hypothetical protein